MKATNISFAHHVILAVPPLMTPRKGPQDGLHRLPGAIPEIQIGPKAPTNLPMRRLFPCPSSSVTPLRLAKMTRTDGWECPTPPRVRHRGPVSTKPATASWSTIGSTLHAGQWAAQYPPLAWSGICVGNSRLPQTLQSDAMTLVR
jgi:hypothetical protein